MKRLTGNPCIIHLMYGVGESLSLALSWFEIDDGLRKQRRCVNI